MTSPGSASGAPLKTNWFHILLCLADGDQHGYAIMREVLERTDGKVRLWPATLYGALRRLADAGLIEESGGQPATDDMRRRFYRLTSDGRDVLASEIRRLEALLRAARAKGRSLKTEPSS
jgi:DNA-binding PadR family transcriptional regulator